MDPTNPTAGTADASQTASAAGTSGTSAPPSAPAGGQTSAAPGSSSAASGSQATSGAAAGSSSGTATAAAGSSTAAAASSSVRDLVSRLGGADLGQQFQSDEALVQNLLAERQRAQQLQQFAQYGQQVMPHWSEFQSFLKDRQAAAQQPAQQKPWWSEFWSPPEYDPSWERQVQQDAQGNFVPAPGAPPDVVNKVLAFRQYRAAQAERLMQNPFQFFEQPIKTLAQQVASQVIQQHMGQYQDQLFAREVTQRNAAWLYQRDQQGNLLTEQNFDPRTGQTTVQPVLSPSGQAFRQYVMEAHGLGVTDMRGQERYAMAMLQAQWAQAQSNQGAAAAQNQAAQQKFLQQGAHAPNAGGSVSPPNLNGAAPSQNQNLSLAERMRQRLRENGVTDQDLAGVR